METKEGVNLYGLEPVMRPVLKAADQIWIDHGRSEGVTVTSTVDSVHSAGSWHPYGYAVDFRTNYFTDEERLMVYTLLKQVLPRYDVVLHKTHIHVEIGDELAKELGVLF